MEGDVEPRVCVPFATKGTKVAKSFYVLFVPFVAKVKGENS